MLSKYIITLNKPNGVPDQHMTDMLEELIEEVGSEVLGVYLGEVRVKKLVNIVRNSNEKNNKR